MSLPPSATNPPAASPATPPEPVVEPTAAAVPRRRLPTWLRWLVRTLRLFLEWLAAALLLLGAGLHTSVRDGIPLLAPFFYALPAMVLVLLAVAGWVVSRHRLVWAAVVLGIGGWAATQVLAVNLAPAVASEAPRFRLLSWNTFNDELAGEEAHRVVSFLTARQPTLAGIVEAGLGDEASGRYSPDRWRTRTGLEPRWLRWRFLTLAEAAAYAPNGAATRDAADPPLPPKAEPAPSPPASPELPPADDGSLDRAPGDDEARSPIVADLRLLPDLDVAAGGHHRRLSFTLPDAAGRRRTVTWILVHSKSDPLYDRREIFRTLTLEVERLAAEGPVLLSGDFNLPAESALLDRLRSTMRRAAEVAPGIGYLPTWPLPCPVLTLDQVWVSRHFEVHAASSPYHLGSDHEPVVVDLSLRAEGDDLTHSP